MNVNEEVAEDGTVIIGAGVEFKGEITVPGRASVNGNFEGTLRAKDLIVGDSGRVSGQISADTAEIRGTVADNLTVQSKLILRSSGSISGSVTYSKITVEEGGVLTGRIEKIDAQNPSQTYEQPQHQGEQSFE